MENPGFPMQSIALLAVRPTSKLYPFLFLRLQIHSNNCA